MFKPIKCPNCGVEISQLEISPATKNAKWYTLTRVEHVCPYCREGVEYDKKSQRKGFIVFLLLAIISVLILLFSESEIITGGGSLFFLSAVVGLVVFSKNVKLVHKK